MTKKVCDNASVGVLISDPDDRWLLLRRATPPVGIAPCAGHVFDDHSVRVNGVVDETASYRAAAVAEVSEELGLTVTHLDYVTSGWRTAACRRAPGPRGPGHDWRVYRAEVTGALRPSERETHGARWYTRAELQTLAKRTIDYAWRQIIDTDFEAAPGIEPVWCRWLHDADIIHLTGDDLDAVEELLTRRARGLSCNRTENGVSGPGRTELSPFVVRLQVEFLLPSAGTPTADRPLIGMCDSARCPQATHHPRHRPVWAEHANKTKTFLGELGPTRKNEGSHEVADRVWITADSTQASRSQRTVTTRVPSAELVDRQRTSARDLRGLQLSAAVRDRQGEPLRFCTRRVDDLDWDGHVQPLRPAAQLHGPAQVQDAEHPGVPVAGRRGPDPVQLLQQHAGRGRPDPHVPRQGRSRCSTVTAMGTRGKDNGAQRRTAWAEREAEYQRMLGRRAPEGQNATPAAAKTKPSKPPKPVRERRSAAQLPDVKPRKVACPRCAALAGNPCRNERGRQVDAHAERVRAAAKAGHRTPRRVIAQRQLQAYLDGAGESSSGGGSNPVSVAFSAARESRTTRGRSSQAQRRIDGL